MKPLTARQERFCRRYVEWGNAANAARAAGYAIRSARSTGYRLLQEPHVAARIADIQAQLGRIQCRLIDTLLGKLEGVFLQAVEECQFSAAARVVELQARLSGLATTRTAAPRPAASAEDEPAIPTSSPFQSNQGDQS